VADDFMNEDEGQDLFRLECPHCGKGFDVVEDIFRNEGLICPYCGEEIEV
jgi:DNA-directed RNA polymerase subunit RPC12/RpoP